MYKRILVPVDGSPTSAVGAAEAIALAKVTGGQLRFMHHLDELPYLSTMDGGAALVADALPILRSEGENLLKRMREQATSAGVTADAVLVDSAGGRLSDHVVEQAGQWKADLVVVGTHGRRGLGRVLLGSGAEDVARNSPVPVLLVRGKDAGEEP